jgi:hypothetical protein
MYFKCPICPWEFVDFVAYEGGLHDFNATVTEHMKRFHNVRITPKRNSPIYRAMKELRPDEAQKIQ